jgi:hypothetical protein
VVFIESNYAICSHKYKSKNIRIVKSIFTNSTSPLELVKIDYNLDKLKGLDDAFNFLEDIN